MVKLEGEEGDEHDVIIAYVVESPIWRPTYRIVMDEAGKKALLQGWAVVQNLSGEDWEDVRLTVTEGAPLTFRADLGNPYIPIRPLVTDRGEVVQAAVASSVSVSEATRREMERQQVAATNQSPAEPMAAANYDELYDIATTTGYRGGPDGYGAEALAGEQPAAEDAAPMRRRADASSRASGGGGGPGYPTVPASGTAPLPPPPPPPPQGLTAGGAQASLALLALGSQEGGITTYEAVAPVTVRDEASTLVAIFNESVEASDTLLYRPDPGVPVSTQHPFRVIRFTNQAGVTLERGPVAIFGKETFLGQGLLEPLPTGATTSIPYAVERAVVVSVENGSDIEEANLVKVSHGAITVRRYSVRKTKYVVQNLSDRPGKLFIQHSRWSGWELRNLPEGSEEVDTLTVIVPVELGAQAKTEIEVLERSPTIQEVLILTDVGRDAVRLYLSGPAVDDARDRRCAGRWASERMAGSFGHRRFTDERNQVAGDVRDAEQPVRHRGIARGRLRTRLTNRLSDLEKRTTSCR